MDNRWYIVVSYVYNIIPGVSNILKIKKKNLRYNLQKLPANEIYGDETISIFEIDSRENKTFTKNLYLLSVVLLKSKMLYYEIEPFIFCALYEYSKTSNHSIKDTNTNIYNSNKNEMKFVVYFSKENLKSTKCNLSCILISPTNRWFSFGFLLIDFSCLFTKKWIQIWNT